MTKLLEQTVNGGGTLAGQKGKFEYKASNGRSYRMPAAGKTGTTQNWADAWTCGFTPYYAAAFWFGFDKPGQSLGLNITGSTLAGYAWGDFMGQIHSDLPSKEWSKPLEGVVEATVCSVSGQLLTDACGDHKTTQWFLEGTVPTELCPVHSNTTNSAIAISRLEKEMYQSGQRRTVSVDSSPLKLNLDFLKDGYDFSKEESSVTLDDDTSFFSGKYDDDSDIDYNYLME